MINKRVGGGSAAAAAAGGIPVGGMVSVDVRGGHLFVPQNVGRVRLAGFPASLVSTVVALEVSRLSGSTKGTRTTTAAAVDINIIIFFCCSFCDDSLEYGVQGIPMPLEGVGFSVTISGHGS